MSHNITIDATQHGISSVCVFQANRAEVRRVIEVELQAGQNEVEISRLPNCLDKDSVRVDGIGNAVIFDVVYSPPPPVDPFAINLDDRKTLKELRNKEASLKSEKDALQQQGFSLDKYSDTLTADKVDITTLTTFLDLYLDKKATIHEKIAKAMDEIEDVETKIRELQNRAYIDLHGKKRTVKVTVVVLAEKEGRAELLLSYVVTHASWTPLYDLRAKISNNTKEPSSVSVSYRASISQQTGEDWNSVDLTLSTASPLLGRDVPNLQPHHIRTQAQPNHRLKPLKRFTNDVPNTAPMVIGYSTVRERGPERTRRTRKSSSSSGSPEPQIIQVEGAGSYGPHPPTIVHIQAPMIAPIAAAVEGAVSTAFIIEGKSTIPSDNDVGAQTHKVSIAVIDLLAKMEWVATPKVKPATFLQCQVKNTSPYVFLPGTSNVFMDDNFVCKSSIPSVSPQESFSTSLGVDASVKITYHPLQKKTKASTGSILGSKFDVTSFTQNITIKNTRGGKIDKLIVNDQVPVSEESSLKVTLIEPKDLGLAKERKEVVISREVRARWSFKGGEKEEDEAGSTIGIGSLRKGMKNSGSGAVEGEGMLEWICELDGGRSVDLSLVYEVSSPAGQRWETA